MQDIVSTALKIGLLGQVFTPPPIVEFMLRLRRNCGRVLEPSCGDGAFARQLTEAVAIELDPTVAASNALVMDFFAYPESERFDTIIGNPPYVRHQDIAASTRRLLKSSFLDARANLYLFFIEKCVRHLAPGGELIFITPRDFLKATSAVRLNTWLFEQGTITHAVETGDARVFDDATPNCLIWRFEKGRFDRTMQYAELEARLPLEQALAGLTWQERYFTEAHGHLMFLREPHPVRLHEIASVKVGAVSGADDLFTWEAWVGNGALSQEKGKRSRQQGKPSLSAAPAVLETLPWREFVCSHTVRTGATRRMLWTHDLPSPPAVLLPYKARLISRRVRAFDESNWWQWGRDYPQTDAPRVYVNTKTRAKNPFFLHPCPHFDGSVLALFPHDPYADLKALCNALNAVDWAQLGFVCDGRYLFSQRSLAHAPLPEALAAFRPAPRDHQPPA